MPNYIGRQTDNPYHFTAKRAFVQSMLPSKRLAKVLGVSRQTIMRQARRGAWPLSLLGYAITYEKRIPNNGGHFFKTWDDYYYSDKIDDFTQGVYTELKQLYQDIPDSELKDPDQSKWIYEDLCPHVVLNDNYLELLSPKFKGGKSAELPISSPYKEVVKNGGRAIDPEELKKDIVAGALKDEARRSAEEKAVHAIESKAKRERRKRQKRRKQLNNMEPGKDFVFLPDFEPLEAAVNASNFEGTVHELPEKRSETPLESFEALAQYAIQIGNECSAGDFFRAADGAGTLTPLMQERLYEQEITARAFQRTGQRSAASIDGLFMVFENLMRSSKADLQWVMEEYRLAQGDEMTERSFLTSYMKTIKDAVSTHKQLCEAMIRANDIYTRGVTLEHQCMGTKDILNANMAIRAVQRLGYKVVNPDPTIDVNTIADNHDGPAAVGVGTPEGMKTARVQDTAEIGEKDEE